MFVFYMCEIELCDTFHIHIANEKKTAQNKNPGTFGFGKAPCVTENFPALLENGRRAGSRNELETRGVQENERYEGFSMRK